MKQTPNINLPILEQGDKYLKETQNEAFSVIDREIAGLNSAISVLDNVEGSIINTKSDVETLKNETNALKSSLNDMASNVIPNIQTSLENIVAIDSSNYILENGYLNVDLINYIISTNNKGKLKFVGDCKFDKPLLFGKGWTFEGDGRFHTIVTYEGEGNAFIFPSGLNSEWEFRGMKFKGWQLRGTKNNNGIIFKRNDTDMSNISFVQFDDFEVNNFDIGMWIEGFSHTLKDTSAQNCNKGIILIRPNSVNCMNIFVYNCINGVVINPLEKYKQYHQFYFQGSIQSCDVGMTVNAGYESTIELYTEHNRINDVVCGKGTTDRGLWDFNLRLNSNNECSECCVYFDNIVSGNITFNAVGLSTEIPHFIANSNCSDVTLNVRTSCIKSSTLIQATTSVDRAIKILKDGIEQKIALKGTLKQYLKNNIISFQKQLVWFSNKDTLEDLFTNMIRRLKLNGSKIVISNNSDVDLLTIDETTVTNNNDLINKGDLTVVRGKYIYLHDSNGKKYKLSISTNGELIITAI